MEHPREPIDAGREEPGPQPRRDFRALADRRLDRHEMFVYRLRGGGHHLRQAEGIPCGTPSMPGSLNRSILRVDVRQPLGRPQTPTQRLSRPVVWPYEAAGVPGRDKTVAVPQPGCRFPPYPLFEGVLMLMA